jgi:hypothetical protein
MKMLRAIRELGGTAPASPHPSVTQIAEPFRDLVNAAKLPWRIERNQPLDLSLRRSAGQKTQRAAIFLRPRPKDCRNEPNITKLYSLEMFCIRFIKNSVW